MDALKTRRRIAKGKLTRIEKFVESSTAATTKQAIHVRLAGLETTWLEIEQINQAILELGDNEEIASQEAEFEEIESRYYQVKTKLSELLALGVDDSQAASSVDVKLPRIVLPTFSGNYLEWTAFHDLFTSMIHKNTKLSPSQKLHYLKNSVTGEAAGLLQSIEISDTNYVEAWTLLTDRYQNDRQLIQCQLKALFSQPVVSTESAGALRKLLDNTTKHVRALHALGLDTDHWDHILVFFVAERLDNNSRRQWVLSSPGKTYP